MDLRLKKLKNWIENNVFLSKEILFFLTAFILTLFTSSNKLFVLFFLFIGLFLFLFCKKNIIETFILVFLISIPFENTLREWIYTITPPLFSKVATSGYDFYFGVSMKILFGFGLFLLMIFKHKKIGKIKEDLGMFFLLMFFLIAGCNSILIGGTFPFLGFVRVWLAMIIFITSRYFFSKRRNLFFSFIVGLLFFSILVGTFQFIKQKPLGSYIELTPSFSEDFGYSTSDGEKQYRVSGFISHPVYFASFISILFPIAIGFFLKRINEKTSLLKINLFSLFVLITSVIIFGTLSRSALFTLMLIIFIFRKKIRQKVIKRYEENKKIKTVVLILFVLFISISVYFLIPRIMSFGLIFNENGNASIRWELIKKSFEIIGQNPLGVGLNNFTTELVRMDLPESLNGFIVPVHNTFLIFFTELGIPGGIFFMLFIFYVFFKNFSKKNGDLDNFGVWLGILTFLVNSQIHPLFNLDPTFDLLMVVLGYYSVCLYQKK